MPVSARSCQTFCADGCCSSRPAAVETLAGRMLKVGYGTLRGKYSLAIVVLHFTS
ncbi:MAG: hypothetical protein BWY83_02125 [bacterium ADurb.Bin478]|nr:MAG: hypothetical protein BWY83_02125 [bacterium ADurb.Bin478]